MTPIDQKPSTSLIHSQTISNKSTTKPQINDAVHQLDFIPESSFDSNKNYTKNTNKVINGTKVSNWSKKLEEEWGARKTRKSWSIRNGMVEKSKRYRNLRSSRKETRLSLVMNVINEEEDNLTGSNSSFVKTSPQAIEQVGDDDVAVENIAERIKRRKENAEKKTSEPGIESNVSKRSKVATKKKSERIGESLAMDQATFSMSQESTEVNENSMRRTKRRKMSKSSQNNMENLEKNELSTNAVSSSRKSARNSTKISSMAGESDGARNRNNSKFNYDSPPESGDEIDECVSESKRTVGICDGKLLSDDEVIEEQQRMERLLLQERADLEFARRLQAEYDEMERMAGRTRRSRKTVESERSVNVDAREINTARTVRKTSGVREATKRKRVAASTATKGQRGRPKRMKISVDAREDETRAR